MVGCVGQGDYDQLMVANRAALAEKAAAEQRALDAEVQADALRNQLKLKEQELGVQEALVANLRGENSRLDQQFANLQALMKGLDLNPDRPLIIQSPLPPELDAALKNFAAAHPDAVEYDSARGAVKWKADLLFASGSDVMREDAKSTLRGFADIVNAIEANNFDVIVVGHTDNDPIMHAKAKGHPTNWHLAAHRSIAVAFELLQDRVRPDRVGVMGYGEHRPIAANDNKEHKSQNRRVEIFLVSNTNRQASSSPELSGQGAAQAEPQK
jgi:chemotaxis protein MotB